FEFAFLDADFFFFLCLARALALFLHQSLESRDIDFEPALARHQFSEIEWKSLLIIQAKCKRPRNRRCAAGYFALEKLNAFIECSVEGFFFASNYVFDCFLFCADFGENGAHCLRNDIDKLEEERFMKSKRPPITNCPAKNATQNVTAPLI